jgi:cell division protein FtsQ
MTGKAMHENHEKHSLQWLKPRKRTPAMAKRKTPEGKRNFFRKPVKLAILGCLVSTLVLTLVWLQPQLKIEQLLHRPINVVQIEGSFHYLAKETIETAVVKLVKGSFLDLNIIQLKEKLEQNPWVDSIAVSREWPDRLLVKVIEQQPIARWGDNAFLNMRGDIVRIEKTNKIDALPYFHGDDRYAKEIMQQFLSMGKLLAQNELELAAVDLDPTMAWTLTLTNGIVIKLGRDQLWDKLHHLIAAKKGILAKNFNKVEKVDMRYPGGFAIAWKATVENQYVAGG